MGDWVALELGGEKRETMIRARLQRQTCLSRKASGRSAEEQVIAANVSVAVVVTDAGADLNLRRVARYSAIIGKSGAKAVVLVNNSDLFPPSKNQEAAEAIRALNPAADVHITSAQKGTGLKVLRQYLGRGVTLTLVGSSGVGKSSLTNYLVGEEFQWTDEVNEITGKGRHSTTARELIVLPGGTLRVLRGSTAALILQKRFADIAELAAHCKFHDCKHETDAACAIRAVLAADKLERAPARGIPKARSRDREAARQPQETPDDLRPIPPAHSAEQVAQTRRAQRSDREYDRFVR